MKKRMLTVSLLSFAGLVSCGNQQDTAANAATIAMPMQDQSTKHWYSEAQVVKGNTLFQKNCASCHKTDASGTPNWKERDPNGKWPPPPLNGTAHTWHHPLSVLQRTVRIGGVPLGGSMPGFAGKLSNEQINDILAWVQSHWPDEIYSVWQERNAQANRPLQRINKS